MTYLKQFFSYVFSRQTLAFLAIVLLALFVWFVGPLLSFNDLHPLASVGARVSAIVLLLVLAILILLKGPVSLVGVAALCMLIWHGGPLLAVGAAKPLEPVWIRVAIVAGILLACAIYWIVWLLQRVATDKDFLASIFKRHDPDATEASIKEEVKTLNSTFDRALRQLRKLRGRGGLRSILEGRRYLYELPWYMVIGSPGAGKTSAVLNSGLQFPLGREANIAPQSSVMQYKMGTMHCDWWFTNEAVLLDTAGRFVVHEKHDKDPLEWHAFLGILRKHRPRAPVNGVVVALGADELLNMTDDELVAHSEMLRDRLADLRQQLGIQFPVYVIVTKTDLLQGFEEFFSGLTTEHRAQVWGFTLPLQGRRAKAKATPLAQRRATLQAQIATEMDLLRRRLEAGMRSRMVEQHDLLHRKTMFALPQELSGLSIRLTRMIEEVFLDSRFDNTQANNGLRGVYLTSAAQVGEPVPADRFTLMGWLRRVHSGASTGNTKDEAGSASPDKKDANGADRKKYTNPLGLTVARQGGQVRGIQGYFLHDVFAKVVIPEANLVRPNLRWELRFRLLRLMGHALAIVLFLWVASALMLSFGNNRDYLASIGKRTEALTQQVKKLYEAYKADQVPEVLSASRELPGYPGLKLSDPPSQFQWGLYSPPPVVGASQTTYTKLQENLLLPTILRRMETVLADSVRAHDSQTAYRTLRAYKLMHDPQRYMSGGAQDVRDWILRDWQEHPEGVAAFGGRASMVTHVQTMFSGERLVQSATVASEKLVREVQDALNRNTSSQRVYERAKAAMMSSAPADFTLVSAVGPQVGTVFARAGGAPLEKGVPGLFTYEGYHQLFSKRLPEFVGRAMADDTWVMGRFSDAATSAGSAVSASAGKVVLSATDPMLEDVRRRYLQEYAQQWGTFLESIRLVGASDSQQATPEVLQAQPAAMQALGTSTGVANLGFHLSVLRQLAAPDSPLARLARAAARETTLSAALDHKGQGDRGFFDKATDAINKGTQEIGASLNIRPEERMERELVDNQFAALREVVVGQADAGAAGGTAKPGLQAMIGLINEFYTVLVVADTALSAGTLPPAGAEVGARMKLEADKLPAPFRAILTALATQGTDQVAKGSSSILRMQAQQQLDRVMGLMAFQVSEPCKRGVEGRYPFADVTQDASVEDVAQVFAAGGAADAFFNKYLAPFVDTSVRPWRYKSPDGAALMMGAENFGAGPVTGPAPATTGPTLLGELLRLLAQAGPNLDTFYKAQQIRQALFRAADGKGLGWKMDVKVMALDPSITDLIIDIDGQGERYVHGPVHAFEVQWPGPRGGGTAHIQANPRIADETSTIRSQGPWALLRLLDKGKAVGTAASAHTQLEYTFDGRKALLDVATGSQPNALDTTLLRSFRCPGRTG